MEGIRDHHRAPRGVYLANLAVRFALELAALAIAVVWARHVSDGVAAAGLGLLGVALIATVWGLLVSPKAALDPSRAVRWLTEAIVFGTCSVGLGVAAGPRLGAAFATIAVVSGLIAHA